MKKLLSILLSMLFVVFLTSCTQTADCTIKSDGSVSVVSEVLLTQDEYNQLIAIRGESDTESEVSITDTNIDGVQYKKMTNKQTYPSLSSFKEDMMDSFESEITTKELYFVLENSTDNSSNSTAVLNLFFTMPYKIVKTNGEKTGDCTVKFNNITSGNYYYVVTEASNTTWATANDTEDAIKKVLFDKVRVANFKFTPKLSSTLKSVTLKNDSGYTILNGKNYFDNMKLSYIEVFRKTNNGKYTKIKTIDINKNPIKNTVYTDKTIKPNKKYTYRIRGVYKEGNLIKYSSLSSAKSVTITPKVPSITVKSNKKKTATISWKKLSGVDGYVVYRSTKKNSGYKKVTTIKKASTKSYINKKLKSKITYYYKVRSYKKVNGKTAYSNYSSIKKVKIK